MPEGTIQKATADPVSNRSYLIRKLNHWIVEPKDGQACRQVSLVHLTSEGGPQPVNHWQIPADCNVEELATQIEEEALSTGGRFKGVQDFSVRAHYALGGAPGATAPLRIYIEEDSLAHDFGETLPSEGPHGKGVLQMAMRQNEAYFRGTIGVFADVSRLLMGIIRDLREDNQKCHAQLMTFREKYEDALDRTAERELAVYKVVEEEKRHGEMVTGGMALLPAIVNKLVGKPLLPDSTDAEVLFIRSWLKRLELKHLEQLQTILPVELWMPLAQAKEQIMEEDEAAEQAKKAAAKTAVHDVTKDPKTQEAMAVRDARGQPRPPLGDEPPKG